MCIIVAKNKGVGLPTRATLKTCFEYNSDGAGLMYVKDKKVIIEKGFMTFGDFWHKIKELKKEFNSDLTDKAIVMHFRIGTHGENDKATTHPFAISKNSDDLRATYFETDIAMAHNGIIREYNYDEVLSDTQSFVKDYVSIFKDLNKNFYKNERVMQLISDRANIYNNKLCFLDKNENIYWYGDKVIDNGVIYSNTTYKTPKYSYSSYNWNYDYTNYWHDYDYDYDYDYKYFKPTKLQTKNKIKDLKDVATNNLKFHTLEEGDYYQTLGVADFVGRNEIIKIDNKGNLYEKIDNVLSLIGTHATIYDKNWKVKEIKFE